MAAIASREATNEGYLARLKAIPTSGFAEQDVLSHELMQRSLEQGEANYKFKEFEMPVSQMDGPHTNLADLPLAVPFDSVKHYEDYIARLHQVPRVFMQTEDVLRQGIKDNPDAGEISAGEGAGAVLGRDCGGPVSDSAEEVSG